MSHTIQLILIEADNADLAFLKVEQELNNEGAVAWSDWHEATNASTMDFAGRWSGSIFLTPENKKIKEAGGAFPATAPNHLCYADDPELADEVLDLFITYRKENLKANIPTGLPDFEKLVSDYDPKADRFDLNLYKATHLLQILSGDWSYDTAIYDLSAYSASIDYFIKRCAVAPEKQFLIPVDFHY